jgi:LmbE family N-acetylglucosaminyl deacetylase
MHVSATDAGSGMPAGTGRRALRAGARPVKRGLGAAWRRALRAGSRDDTAATEGRRALVLAPHPDDETIGPGATIARKRSAGTDVRVLVATDGRHSHRSDLMSADELARVRAGEFEEACDRLGVAPDQRLHLGFEEGTLGRRLPELVALLREHVADFAPDEVLVTSGLDWHEDHRMLSRAVQQVVAGPGDAPQVREYPVWAWVDGPWSNRPGRGAVRSAVDLVAEPWGTWRSSGATHVMSGPHLERKRAALQAYRSQLTRLTGEAGWATFDERFLRLVLGDREIFLTPARGA